MFCVFENAVITQLEKSLMKNCEKLPNPKKGLIQKAIEKDLESNDYNSISLLSRLDRCRCLQAASFASTSNHPGRHHNFPRQGQSCQAHSTHTAPAQVEVSWFNDFYRAKAYQTFYKLDIIRAET